MKGRNDRGHRVANGIRAAPEGCWPGNFELDGVLLHLAPSPAGKGIPEAAVLRLPAWSNRQEEGINE